MSCRIRPRPGSSTAERRDQSGALQPRLESPRPQGRGTGRRRLLLGAAGAGLVAPAWAQPARPAARVGVLTPADVQWQRPEFEAELSRLVRLRGISVELDVRSADGDLEKLPALARQLVDSGVSVIVGVNTPGTRAAMAQTRSVPIVSGAVGDPVLLGIVRHLARPEANVTGVTNMASDITTKRLEVLLETVPQARRIAVLYHPDEPIVEPQRRDLDSTLARLALEGRYHAVRTEPDLERALADAARWPAQALLRLAGQGATLARRTAELALLHRIPAMGLLRADVQAGVLVSYFADHGALWRRVAAQVDRLLAGDRVESIPFEQPVTFELAFNLRTARALGLTVAPALLARADEIVE